jgi:hypothetical protein
VQCVNHIIADLRLLSNLILPRHLDPPAARDPDGTEAQTAHM